jgi:hypothetical protein
MLVADGGKRAYTHLGLKAISLDWYAVDGYLYRKTAAGWVKSRMGDGHPAVLDGAFDDDPVMKPLPDVTDRGTSYGAL